MAYMCTNINSSEPIHTYLLSCIFEALCPDVDDSKLDEEATQQPFHSGEIPLARKLKKYLFPNNHIKKKLYSKILQYFHFSNLEFLIASWPLWWVGDQCHYCQPLKRVRTPDSFVLCGLEIKDSSTFEFRAVNGVIGLSLLLFHNRKNAINGNHIPTIAIMDYWLWW
jgi:hypothetical protein